MNIPLQSTLPKTYRIKDIVQNTPMVRTLTFEGSIGAKPGQFVMVWLPGLDEIPLSVAFDDGAETKLTFFAVGDFTHALAARQVGDLVGLRGPFGTYYTWEPGEHIVMVAGGYGAAPMYFVAHEAVSHGCTMEVIVGARSKEHLLYIDELQALEHISVHVVTDDGSEGRKGFTTDILREIIAACKIGDPTCKDGKPVHQIFACGPELMLKKVFDMAEEFGIPAQISMARYMKCGYGLCGSCTLEPLGIRLCVEGPILKSDVLRHV
ncbi:MAG: hypothetical protein JWM56_1434, partial [Candidatus Peribacteria bacterium]|nr:hypothetical protein [Candidatus Peribacteria bacterium]